jgi:penicillin amidase
MKKFKIIAGGILALLVVAFIGALIFAGRIARKGLPDYATDVKLRGMTEEVTVYRDAYAIPHIFAKNEDDLYRATGYVMAQDRLWQMDLIRRATSGRLAEIFGDKLVDADLLMRTLRISEKSRRVLAASDPALVRSLSAYADGVNQFIESHKDKLPLEFTILGYVPEPWAPEHTLNLIGYVAWMGSDRTSQESFFYRAGRLLGFDSPAYRELLPDPALFKTVIHPDFKLAPAKTPVPAWRTEKTGALAELGLILSPASNNWAVSGERSETGKPLVANDMHLELFLPGLWYQMHQVVEGGLDVTGVAFPGSPAVLAGHNARIAWGMTFVHQDAMDFYQETLNPQNPLEYKFNDAWRPMETRREVIAIKGGRSVTREVRSTHRGPIVSDESAFGKGDVISMRWLGMDDSNEMRAVIKLDHARDWDEFRDAVKDFVAVGVNVVYGDVEGNIGMSTCAGVPIRAKGDGLGVAPGDTDDYDWTGLVPFEELPYTFNPPEGAVSSANNKPADGSYPHAIGHSFDRIRIERIRQLLAEKPKFTVEDFARMQADITSVRAEGMVPVLVGELARIPDLSAEERDALAVLKAWNFRYTADGAAPLIFERLYARLARDIAGDELGPELEDAFMNVASGDFMAGILQRPDSPWWDDVRTKDKRESASEILRRSFGTVVADLENELGRDARIWSWGAAHSLTLKHPLSQVKILERIFRLNRGPFKLGGNFDTLDAYSYPQARGFQVGQGPSQRHVFDTADWNRSLSVIPTGESGIPASPHYGDQTGLYVGNRYHPDLVARDLIEKAAKYKMRIGKAEESK